MYARMACAVGLLMACLRMVAIADWLWMRGGGGGLSVKKGGSGLLFRGHPAGATGAPENRLGRMMLGV